MGNWTLTTGDYMERKEVSIPDSKIEDLWKELGSYKGSHKDFFLNKFGDKR